MIKLTTLVLLFCIVFSAYAEVPVPKLERVRFDDDGKLVAKLSDLPIAGCYLTIYGGLSSKKVDTAIIGITLTDSQANKESITIKTRRKYFCKKRTLYVTAESVCLNSEIGQATSNAKAVSVPVANLK